MSYIDLIEQYTQQKMWAYQLITKGWDFDVILTDTTAYRFPKAKFDVNELMDKQRLDKRKLDLIAHYVNMPIPQFTIVDNAFVSYPLIQWASMSDVDFKPYANDVITDLVLFLRQLHSIPLDKFDFLNSENNLDSNADQWALDEHVKNLKSDLDKRLHGRVSHEVIQTVLNYVQELYYGYKSPLPKVFAHQDLQPNNIVWNTDANRISWIIDFSESGIYSPEVDFSSFHEMGEWVLEKMVEWYRWYADKEFVDRVVFLGRRGVLFEITNDDIYNKEFDYLVSQLKKHGFMNQ